jgi:hypothetical protein
VTDLAVLQDGLAEELAQIAEAAATERVSPDVLFRAFARVLTRAHIEAALAGRQAVTQQGFSGALSHIMDVINPLRGGLSEKLASELKYAANFVRDITSGRLSPAQIQMRFQMYAQHIQQTYFGAQTDVQRAAGMTEERRVLNPGESCADCIAYAARGWVPIGTLPEPGEESECQANCNCGKEYR